MKKALLAAAAVLLAACASPPVVHVVDPCPQVRACERVEVPAARRG